MKASNFHRRGFDRFFFLLIFFFADRDISLVLIRQGYFHGNMPTWCESKIHAMGVSPPLVFAFILQIFGIERLCEFTKYQEIILQPQIRRIALKIQQWLVMNESHETVAASWKRWWLSCSWKDTSCLSLSRTNKSHTWSSCPWLLLPLMNL